MNRFAILREEQAADEFYETGPWGGDRRYLEPSVEERLHHEISDISEWLEPTADELQIRLLTISRFTKVIEQRFPGCIVIPQGSSATKTFLPTSDIDLIVLNLPESQNPVDVLHLLSKVFQKSKMVSKSFVIGHAHVPIAKMLERPFGFHIDLCASNINGALNIERMGNMMNENALFKPMLMFLKLFIWATGVDDPAKGGFGSNLLMNLVHFGFQSRPDIKNLGDMMLYLFDVIANKMNFFLAGVTTVGGGALFSKVKRELLTDQCPNAFVFEDPQFHGNHIGVRTSSIDDLIEACANALEAVRENDYVHCSAISAFMPDVTGVIARRNELARFARLLHGPVKYFAAETDSVPTFVKYIDGGSSKNQKHDKMKATTKSVVAAVQTKKKKNKKQLAQKQREKDEWDDYLVKSLTKRHIKEERKEEKKKREKEQRQQARLFKSNFHAMWLQAQEQAKQSKRQSRERMRDMKRTKSPSRHHR